MDLAAVRRALAGRVAAIDATAWRERARGIGRTALDALLPPRCLSCGASVDAPGALCAACWAGIEFIAPPLCDCCGFPFEIEAGPDALCAACLARRPRYRRARAAFRYGEDSRRLVLMFKHADRLDPAPAFGRWMAQAGAELLADADVIAPVPLHRWRLLYPLSYGYFTNSIIHLRRIPKNRLLGLGTSGVQKSPASDPKMTTSGTCHRTQIGVQERSFPVEDRQVFRTRPAFGVATLPRIGCGRQARRHAC